MSKTLDNFYAALKRLKDGNPKFVDIPYSINNDTVSLEAKRKRGTEPYRVCRRLFYLS